MLMPKLNCPLQTKKEATSQMKVRVWKMLPHKSLGTFQEVEPLKWCKKTGELASKAPKAEAQ